MISIDTNILMFAFNSDSPFHKSALQFVKANWHSRAVVLSELSMVELYRLIRNPAAVSKPLGAPEAVKMIADYRHHPHWRIVGFPGIASQLVHDRLWIVAGTPNFAYRRIFDARLALTLQHHDVTDFATANVKDFKGFGFQRVWNPLTEDERS